MGVVDLYDLRFRVRGRSLSVGGGVGSDMDESRHAPAHLPTTRNPQAASGKLGWRMESEMAHPVRRLEAHVVERDTFVAIRDAKPPALASPFSHRVRR